MKNAPNRGFKALIGETIKKVDAQAVNVVRIECESGKVVELDCDDQIVGIGIIQVTEVKK